MTSGRNRDTTAPGGRNLRGLPAGPGFLVCAWLVALALAGCQTALHVRTTADYAERPLALDDPEGLRRFEMESELDSTVRDFVARHGKPDYMYVEDRRTLFFFYTTTDVAAVFRRSRDRAWLALQVAEVSL